MSCIRVKNDLTELDTLFGFAAEVLKDNGISDSKLENNLFLCIDELFANIVNHAYADDLPHEILFSLSVSVNERKATLCVEDDGVSFNPLNADEPDIDAAIDERRIGGLGLFIVSRIATEQVYERRGRINVLRVTLGW